MSQRAKATRQGVVLREGDTGSRLFHQVLVETAEAFPDVFGGLRLPEHASAFKRSCGELLPQFEGRRVASHRRVEIAEYMVRRTQGRLRFVHQGREMPLGDHLAAGEAAPPMVSKVLGTGPGLRAEVPFGDRVYRGREIVGLAERLAHHHELTESALAALRWIVEHIEAQDGVLDLRGQRFAMLGAGAELALTPLLLKAGAKVLWIDLADPWRALAGAGPLSGTLLHAPKACDLLQSPRAIGAAIERFASEEGPVHVGMFAYASGASQEWRLCATMNAITMHVNPGCVRSVSMLVSPTTVASLQPESMAGVEQRLADQALWKSAMVRAGLLVRPGHCEVDGARIARAVVSIQGLSYQAAQYVSKMAAAEVFSVYGTGAGTGGAEAASRRPVTVSANVAGITRTRSISHPLFEAAFMGAPQFGVRIFDVPTTRALNGLLTLHDLLNPGAPGAPRVHAEDPRAKTTQLFSQQIHGGVYSLPYALEGAIRMAAVIGMGIRPTVLLGNRSGKIGTKSLVPA